jgi:hypothetical protein
MLLRVLLSWKRFFTHRESKVYKASFNCLDEPGQINLIEDSIGYISW